jgi:uncharacterized protein
MMLNFLDTSALAKHYGLEVGTAKLDALLDDPGRGHFISRLTVVELHSALAKRVRMGQLTPMEFRIIASRFRSDVVKKRFEVIRILNRHFQQAEQLLTRLALVQNLRTLDAIQLAVALVLNHPLQPVEFVCADRALCAIAAGEGLNVINPEDP